MKTHGFNNYYELYYKNSRVCFFLYYEFKQNMLCRDFQVTYYWARETKNPKFTT